jgi:hypothetical protein
MKYILSYIFVMLEVLGNAQPLPDCSSTTTNKLLFIKSNQKLSSNLTHGNIGYSNLDSITNCFTIDYSDIKVGLNKIYFDFKVYKTITDYDLDHNQKKLTQFMHIYIGGLNFKDSVNKYYNDIFTYYLNIPGFKEGTYFIDVSKKSKIKKVMCRMCRDSIDATDITPDKWELENRKKWRKLKCK